MAIYFAQLPASNRIPECWALPPDAQAILHEHYEQEQRERSGLPRTVARATCGASGVDGDGREVAW